MRINIQNLSPFLNSLVVSPRQVINPSRIDMNSQRERIKIFGKLYLRYAFITPAHLGEEHSAPQVCIRGIWVQLDCLRKLLLCLWPVPVIQESDCAKGNMRLCKIVVQL